MLACGDGGSRQRRRNHRRRLYLCLSRSCQVGGAYKKQTGIGLNYQSIGSGGGIKQITNKTVTFGASDMPLMPKDVEKNNFVQFPIINGAVVPLLNLPGIKPGADLRRPDARECVSRRNHQVERSGDRETQSRRQAARYGDCVVHRSDGSGTTFIWTDYLSKVSADWKSKIGESTAVEWPVGIGGKGNEGVSATAAQIPRGRSAMSSMPTPMQNNMTYAKMINQAGKTVAPTPASFMAAAASAHWTSAQISALSSLTHPGPHPGQSPDRPSS